MSLSKEIYGRSPLWVQNCMVSAQGALYAYRRWSPTKTRRLLSALIESQWWNAERFREFQNTKLRQHIKYSAENIPYYKQLFKSEGIDPNSIRHVDDLNRIPLLEKNVVRDQPTRFLLGGRASRTWNKSFTSGTTGTPMNLYTSRESFSRMESFIARLRHWAGLEDPLYPRRAQFTGRDIVPQREAGEKGTYWRRNLPGKSLLLSTTHLSQETVPAYIEAIKSFKPALIDGYPSAILILARVAAALGLDLPRPKAIITSAETLSFSDKQEIESAYGCRVFNQYASSEASSFAGSCEYGVLHINPEYGACELLNKDGLPAKPGEEAEVVATSFCNTEQVFIRYRIGDSVIVGPSETCKCGRAMPRIEEVTGRVDDILFIPDRGFVGRLDPVFKGLSGIYECQVVQESLGRLRLKLVPAPTYDAAIESALLTNLRMKVGTTVSIVVDRVSEIPRGPNGKFRSVVTLCREQYPRPWNG